MSTLDFEELLLEIVREVEPSASQKDGASRSHRYLREILCTGNMEARITTNYLSGSYARQTAIYPLDDVDIIFEIDETRWPIGLFSAHPPPEKVLQTFANAIRYRYNGSSVRTQRRSVRLQMNHLDIDVVPAIRGTGPDTILVPDVPRDKWIVSAPARHKAIATEINQRRGGLFKPLVKLLKAWNRGLPSTAQFKSFAVETMAAHLFQRERFTSIAEGVYKFFDFLCTFTGQSRHSWQRHGGIALSAAEACVSDTGGSGSNVTAGVSSERCKRFLAQATRSRDLVEEAHRARSFDTGVDRMARALRWDR